MGTLATCFPRFPDLEREYKTGLKARARALKMEGVEDHTAEVAAVTETRDKAKADIEKIQKALQPPPRPTPPQFAGRRAEAVKTAAEKSAGGGPEARTILMQKIRDRVTALIAKHDAGMGAGEPKRVSLIQAIAEYNAMLRVLPADIRGKVGAYGELARMSRTEEALSKFFTKAIERIDKVLETELRAEYAEKIANILEKNAARKGPSGVTKSKIGPEAQGLVDRVVNYIELSGEKVETRVNQIEMILSDSKQTDMLTPEQVSALVTEQEELNQYGALEEQSSQELAATWASLKTTIKEGRSELQAKEKERLEKQRAKSGEIVSGLPAASQSGIKAKNRKILQNWFKNFLRSHHTLSQMLGQIIPKASFIKEWQDTSRRQTMADFDFVMKTTQDLSKVLRLAIGKNSSVAVGDTIAKMKEMNIAGPKGMVSKMDAIHYVMAWKQTKERARMEKQGWTKEHIDALSKEISDPVSQVLMKFFRQKYDLIYKKANEVYRRMYGMDLPSIPNYVPMRYEHGALELESDPTGGPLAISGLTPSAIKGRVAHNSELQQADAMDVFIQHLNQMSHWIHTAEMNREMRAVLTNVEAKKALKQSLGQDGYQMVLDQMDAIARNGSARATESKAVVQAISYVAAGKAITSLAFNLHTVVMQFDSALRFMFAIPASRWVPLLVNPKSWANFSKAWHSDTVQRRIIGGMAPDVQYAMQANNLTPSRLLALSRAGMLPINYADAFATSISAAIVYTDAINQGASHEAALDRMDAAVARFSQPTVLAQKSGLEVTSGAAMKLFMMFMSDARLKTGILFEAVSDLRNGRNVGMAIQRILVVEAFSLLGQLISSVYAYALSDDDDDTEWYGDLTSYITALFTAPVQGLVFAGTMAEATFSAIFGDRMYPKADPIHGAYSKLIKAGKHLPDIMSPFEDPESFLKEVNNIAQATGAAAGPMAGAPALVGQAAKWAGEFAD